MKKDGKALFDIKDRGFGVKAWYLKDDKGNALVEITRDGKLYREFTYPTYKVHNISAHFSDIVDGEINNDVSGYEVAGSDGLGGCVYPKQVATEATKEGEVDE